MIYVWSPDTDEAVSFPVYKADRVGWVCRYTRLAFGALAEDGKTLEHNGEELDPQKTFGDYDFITSKTWLKVIQPPSM